MNQSGAGTPGFLITCGLYFTSLFTKLTMQDVSTGATILSAVVYIGVTIYNNFIKKAK